MIEGCIRGGGHIYKDTGLEDCSVWIDSRSAAGLPIKLGKRVEIDLHIGGRSYQGGLRATRDCRVAWICPDVAGADRNLAKIFDRLKWQKNQRVLVSVDGTKITLTMP